MMKYLFISFFLHVFIIFFNSISINPEKVTFKIKSSDFDIIQKHVESIEIKEKKKRIIRSQKIESENVEVQDYFNVLKDLVNPIWTENIMTLRELFKVEDQLNVVSVTINRNGLITKKEIITRADELVADKILEKTFEGFSQLPPPPTEVIKDFDEIIIIWAFSYKIKISKN